MTCRACGGDRLDRVFVMDPMPLAGAFAATSAEALAAERYPFEWHQCRTCGLVNVEPDIPDDVIYATYSYAASSVPALVRHHTALAKRLAQRFRQKRVRLLEIGCNDGVLLKRLPKTWDLIGVDPSDVAARSQQGYALLKTLTPLNADIADIGEVDVVTTSNALAHFSAIGATLDAVAMVLKPGGEFWVEVHDLDATLVSAEWDTCYTEHKVEWSADALRTAVEPRGFAWVSTERLALHGGLLRVIFRRGWKRSPAPVLRSFRGLQRAYDERTAPALAPHSAAYGAAARASVYLNQMPGLPIDYVVDSAPLRAGRYVPGVGLPIVSPEAFTEPATTLITAWNHAEDIKARHPGYDRWVTAW